jgi:hypothetical protein
MPAVQDGGEPVADGALRIMLMIISAFSRSG